MTANSDSDRLKREAARRAIELVEPGMRLGLGTGSTARHFVDLVGGKVAEGLDVLCVATSEATAAQANARGIPLATLEELPELDLTVDGADEVDHELRLIKGGGGALLREKIVAAASRQMAVIADSTKLVRRLGAFPLPVEVVPFDLAATSRVRSNCGAAPSLLSRTAAITFSTIRLARSRIPTAWPRPFPGSRGSSNTACSSAMRKRRSSQAPKASK